MATFHNRPAWQIESDQISVSVMECGAHTAEMTFKPTGINPLWIQDCATIDPDQYDPAIHGALYGDNCESRLMSGVLGHNLCLPYWGNPSEAEYRAGMTCHGETNVIRWRALTYERNRLTIEARVPELGLRVERTLRCSGPVVYFDTVAENLTPLDRPFAWCEHVTLGAPFLASEDTGFFATVGKGFQTNSGAGEVFHWPEGRGQIYCDLRRFSNHLHSDLINAFLVESSSDFACVVAWNPRLGSLYGQVFSASEFPWLNVWENHDQRRMARGMEFSTTPIDGSLKALVANPRLLDTPTFEWLDARSQLTKSFFSFTLAIPHDYQGIASVHSDGKMLYVCELGTGRELTLQIDSQQVSRALHSESARSTPAHDQKGS
jgi:hypothetical protein